MRKYISTLIVLLILSQFSVRAQNRAINFNHGRWSEITALAKAQNKIIFLDAFASWCGPCKWMAANIFTNDTAADFFNATFVNAKIDMEKDEDGPTLARKYGVMAYPTYLFIDQNGELVHRSCGSMPLGTFMSVAKSALNPEKQLGSLKKKYDAGERNASFILRYLTTLSEGCASTDLVKSAYLKDISEKDLTSVTNWQIILRFENDINSREFEYLLRNRSAFAKISSKDTVDKKIYDGYSRAFGSLLQKKDTIGFESLSKKIKASGFEKADELMFSVNMQRYERAKDWKYYNELALKSTDKFKMNDAAFLNGLAWRFFQAETDPKMLSSAEKWSKRAVELDPKAYIIDTYANILYKIGKKDDAVKQIRHAIETAQHDGEQTDGYQATLKKFTEGK